MIKIESDQFAALRESIDSILEKTLADLFKSGEHEAKITATIKIGIEEREVPVSENRARIAYVPTFDFKVTRAKQVKTSLEGSIYRDKQEIVITENGDFVLKRIDGGQMDLFDDDLEYQE